MNTSFPEIFEAIIDNDKLRFEQLLDEDESVIDQITSVQSRDTTLHVASRYGHAHFVSQILSLRPNLVEALNIHDETPIHDACRRGSLKVLDLLLAVNQAWVGLHVNKSCQSPMFLACKYGYRQLVSRLKEINIDADYSCLHIAVSRGHVGVVEELIKAWPSLAEIGDAISGHNLLHYACKHGDSEIARLLLKLKPDLAMSYDYLGFTPLHLATVANINIEEIFKEFEESAPYAFLPSTKNHDTILHLAVRYNRFDTFLSLMRILGDNNDLFHQCDHQGNTLLHLALLGKPSLELAEYLIDNSTKELLQARNDSGLTAVDILELEDKFDNPRIADDFIFQRLGDCLLRKLSECGLDIMSPYTGEPMLPIRKPVEMQSHMTKDSAGDDMYLIDVGDESDEDAKDKDKSKEEPPIQKLNSSSKSSSAVSDDTKSDITHSIQSRHQKSSLDTAVKAILEIMQDKRLVDDYRHKGKQDIRTQEMHMEGLQNVRNTINIIAILIATVSFTGCLSPPGGFFQEGTHIGKPVLGQTTAFKVFAVSNDVALFLSLGIVVILASVIPFRTITMRRLLTLTHKLLWLAVSFQATAYIAARWATMLEVQRQDRIFGLVLSVCGGFLGIIIVGLSVKLINNKLKKSAWKKHQKEQLKEQQNWAEARSFSIDSDVQSRVGARSGFLTI